MRRGERVRYAPLSISLDARSLETLDDLKRSLGKQSQSEIIREALSLMQAANRVGRESEVHSKESEIRSEGWVRPGQLGRGLISLIQALEPDTSPSILPPGRERKTASKLPHADASVIISSVVVPTRGEYKGKLITATSPAWDAIWAVVKDDWSQIYQLPPEKLEELVAASYAREGFEVTLTPRSNDHGRDLIAIKKGMHGYKVIGSVKRYGEGHLVRYDDVRALLGVMSGELNTSKGILVTTSDFPPNIGLDPNIRAFLPYRLQLMAGAELRKWLEKLARRRQRRSEP
jgi:restriction system protein